MKKKLHIILFSLLFTISLQAQVSGYMGKKWLVMYDIYGRPSFILPNANGNHGLTSLNFKNSFALEFVPARSISLGVGYSFFKTKFDFGGNNYDYQGTDGQGATFLAFVPSSLGDISATTTSIYLKIFLNQNLAPLGSYFKFQIDHFKWDWSYDLTKTSQDSAPAGFNDHGSFNSYGISFCLGKQDIYYDRIVFNTSIQIGYLLSGYKINDYSNQWFGGGSITPEMYMKDATSTRLFSHYLWNLNIGIGFLIF